MNAAKDGEVLEGKPAAVCRRTATSEKIYFPARQQPQNKAKERLREMPKNNNVQCPGVPESESRPQSNQELVVGLEKCFTLMVPVQLDRA